MFRLLCNTLLLVAGLCLVSSGSCNALEMPVGIPKPAFGLDESVETSYGSNEYFTYYVDSMHPDATDDENPNGSKEKPRKTPPTDLISGDVVLIAGGVYMPSNDRFYIRARGSRDKPIFFRGIDQSVKPRFQKKIHIVYGSWLIIENIAVDSHSGGIEIRPLAEGMPSDHIAVRNTEVVGLGETFKGHQSYSAHSGFDTSRISDILFYQNENHSSGQYGSSEEDDSPSFSIQHRVQNAWILENTGSRSGGDGVILAHGAKFSTSHIYIGRNHFFDHRENGIDLKEANDVVVSENILHGFKKSNSSAGEAIVIHYEPSRIWILNNEIYDANLGIVTTGSTDTHIIGNIIRDIRKDTSDGWDASSGYASGAAIHFRGASSGSVLNNTIVRTDVGVQLTGGTKGFVVYNNVFYDRLEKDSFDIRVANTDIAAVTSSDSNFFSDIRVSWLGLHESKSSLYNATGQCGLCQESQTDQFVDSVNNNFQLASSSSLINNGQPNSLANRFIELYGARIDRDIMGNPRVSGSEIDIGATELIEGPLPMPPLSLFVK